MYQNLTGKRDVYADVAERFISYIRLGVIKNGEKLPSVREAAGEFGVNPNTVVKAYSQLEEQGYIRSIPKKGAFVIFEENGERDLTEQRELIRAVRQSGLTKSELMTLIEEVYSEND